MISSSKGISEDSVVKYKSILRSAWHGLLVVHWQFTESESESCSVVFDSLLPYGL